MPTLLSQNLISLTAKMQGLSEVPLFPGVPLLRACSDMPNPLGTTPSEPPRKPRQESVNEEE